MTDEEIYQIVRENYIEVNKDYLQDQLRICEERLIALDNATY